MAESGVDSVVCEWEFNETQFTIQLRLANRRRGNYDGFTVSGKGDNVSKEMNLNNTCKSALAMYDLLYAIDGRIKRVVLQ